MQKSTKPKKRARHKADDQLLSNILDHVADPIFVKDHHHRWIYVNQAFSDILGMPQDKFLGKSDYEFFSKAEADVFQEKDNKVFKTGKIDVNEEMLTDSHGRTHIISTKKTRFFDEKGNPVLVGIIRDVTQLKEMERLKNEFISMVSHELRTPLTSIHGALELLAIGALGQLPKEAGSLITIARRNSEQLVHLVNEILDLEKIESGSIRLKPDALPVTEFLKLVIEENHMYGKKYGVAFKLGEVPRQTFVRADRQRLLQVMANLLSNAAKFSSRGATVTLSATADAKNRVCFKIKDQGIGIPKAFHAKVFDKFSQVDSSDTRKQEGAGLGLNITKKLVEAMQGTIAFRSSMGKGTVFYIKLPAEPRQSAMPARHKVR